MTSTDARMASMSATGPEPYCGACKGRHSYQSACPKEAAPSGRATLFFGFDSGAVLTPGGVVQVGNMLRCPVLLNSMRMADDAIGHFNIRAFYYAETDPWTLVECDVNMLLPCRYDPRARVVLQPGYHVLEVVPDEPRRFIASLSGIELTAEELQAHNARAR